MSGPIGKRQRMLLNWKPIVLVGLLPVLDLTCKAPESIGAFVHLLMRMFHIFPLGLPPLICLFHCSRRSDLANERLPDFETARPTIFPVPSMRLSSRKDSDSMDMEYLIKRTLDEDGDDEGGIVEKLAEKIARGRSITAKPSLKRHDTA